MAQCNMADEEATIHEIPLPGHHWLTFRRLVLIVSSCFGLIAIGITLSLIMLHATHYSKPWEQKHIMRILTMVPIYAILSWFSFMYYHDFVYITIAQLVYEAFVIASFYILMCHWIAPSIALQIQFFADRSAPQWTLIRVCGARKPQNGLTWFNITSAAVLQYAMIRPILALVALITQATKQYCEETLSPQFAHLWIEVISIVSTTVAVWGLGNFYYGVRHHIASHRPGSKFIAIKLVVFLTFFQNVIINLLVGSGRIHSSPTIAIQDFRVGLPAILTCVEMAFFAIFHLFSYPWKPYRTGHAADQQYQGGALGVKALCDACNIYDIMQELVRSWKWVLTTSGKTDQEEGSGGEHQAVTTDCGHGKSEF